MKITLSHLTFILFLSCTAFAQNAQDTAGEFAKLATDVASFQSDYQAKIKSTTQNKASVDGFKKLQSELEATLASRKEAMRALKKARRKMKREDRVEKESIEELLAKDQDAIDAQAKLTQTKQLLASAQSYYVQSKSESDLADSAFGSKMRDFKAREKAIVTYINAKNTVEKNKNGTSSANAEPEALKLALSKSASQLRQELNGSAVPVPSAVAAVIPFSDASEATANLAAKTACEAKKGTVVGPYSLCKIVNPDGKIIFLSTRSIYSSDIATTPGINTAFLARTTAGVNCDKPEGYTAACTDSKGILITTSDPVLCQLKDGDHSVMGAQTLCEGPSKNPELAAMLSAPPAAAAAPAAPAAAPFENCEKTKIELTQLILKDHSKILSDMVQLAALKMAYRMSKDKSNQATLEGFINSQSKMLNDLKSSKVPAALTSFYDKYGKPVDEANIQRLFSGKKAFYGKQDLRLDNASASTILLYLSQRDKHNNVAEDQHPFTEADVAAVFAQSQIFSARASQDASFKIGSADANMMNFSSQVYFLNKESGDSGRVVDPADLDNTIVQQKAKIRDVIEASVKALNNEQKIACFIDGTGGSCKPDFLKLGNDDLADIQKALTQSVSRGIATDNHAKDASSAIGIDWKNSTYTDGAIDLKLAP